MSVLGYVDLYCNFYAFLYQSYNKKDQMEPEAQIHKIRITLTSRNVKSLEKGIHMFYT